MMENILDLLINNTPTIVLLAYYIWKDYKFTDQISSILSEIKGVLNTLTVVEASK